MLADSVPAPVPLPLRVEPKPKSGIRYMVHYFVQTYSNSGDDSMLDWVVDGLGLANIQLPGKKNWN